MFRSTIVHPHLTPWLSSVYVPPEHRGRGIATALSLRAVEEARRLGHERIYLFTPNSRALYARLGWQDLEVLHRQGISLTVMVRHTA